MSFKVTGIVHEAVSINDDENQCFLICVESMQPKNRDSIGKFSHLFICNEKNIWFANFLIHILNDINFNKMIHRDL